MVGDLFWAPFPFADSGGFKTRPVLVLVDVQEGQQKDWIVCEVTTSRQARGKGIVIDPGDLAQGSLRRRSSVRHNRLATLNESRFGDYIGRLTDAKTAEILAAVRSLF